MRSKSWWTGPVASVYRSVVTEPIMTLGWKQERRGARKEGDEEEREGEGEGEEKSRIPILTFAPRVLCSNKSKENDFLSSLSMNLVS